uniref:CD151 antigen, like n=1 Tax=Neogobius melanostomus TaxID=47308 RepID=A0A8C6T647_9GOBI
MRNHLLQISPDHLQRSLLAGGRRGDGCGTVDPAGEERLHQPAALCHIRRLGLHPGPGRSHRHVTGVLGCCATFKERRRLLRVYFVLLLCIFLLEVLAGVLAYVYYQQLNEELKQSLRDTMIQKYEKSSHEHITKAVDKLQQEFKCCGSNSSADWAASEWIRTQAADSRKVPDSCCKTPTALCGQRDHPSNIYKVEGGCISKLENFILQHLKIIGAVGIGIACVQVIGMVFTCCLYKSLKVEPY